jgi:hypothetical protein
MEEYCSGGQSSPRAVAPIGRKEGLLEVTEKNVLSESAKSSYFSFLLNADLVRLEDFTKCDGMLVVHVLYVSSD